MDMSQTFTIILEPAEKGCFIVRVPALPEVVTEGDTQVEALAMAQDAIELVIASRRECGEPVPVETAAPVLRTVTIIAA
ncbi:MAG: type II toxin-antitoxin system HicB family antitoxin [Candidatus Competibacteraceae bacterium]|nr:type II toxin-antitoxin system HicB family antitoxin [Candidatus Competibacteraceae bacterium]